MQIEGPRVVGLARSKVLDAKVPIACLLVPHNKEGTLKWKRKVSLHAYHDQPS